MYLDVTVRHHLNVCWIPKGTDQNNGLKVALHFIAIDEQYGKGWSANCKPQLSAYLKHIRKPG